MSLAKKIRQQLVADGVVKPEPLPPIKKRRIQDCTTVIKQAKTALFILPHGMGDCVLFTSVLQHLAAMRPDLIVDVQCKAEYVSIFAGQVRKCWTLEQEPPAEYDLIDRVPFFLPERLPGNVPANKAVRYLEQSLGVMPVAGFCTYRVEPEPTNSDFRGCVLIQAGGRSVKERKNLSQDEFLAVCSTVSKLGFVPVVLNIGGDCPHEIPDDCQVLDESHRAWHGSVTPAKLLGVIRSASMFVGIDSGPGHLAGATDTPAILAWTKHHPIQHYGLAHNVTHLVPREGALLGNVAGEITFFRKWYRHQEYTHLATALAEAVEAELTRDRKHSIRVTVPQGLGDIHWVIRKLTPRYERIELDIGMTAECQIQSRSLEWASIWPQVKACHPRAMLPDDYNALAGTQKTLESVEREWQSGLASVAYAVNRQLENGIPLEAASDFPLITERPAGIPERFVTLAVSEGSLGRPDVWRPEGWRDFWRALADRHEMDLPVVLLGAEFDRVAVERMQELLGAWQRCHVAIGLPPRQAAWLMQHTEFHVGYQSGLNILADHFDRPQVMLYFPSLKDMGSSWAKNPGLLQHFLFSESPESVAAKVKTPFPAKVQRTALLGTWGLGDFIAAYGFMSESERASVKTIYWAARNRDYIEPLAKRAFPNYTRSVEAFREFGPPDSASFCVTDLADLRNRTKEEIAEPVLELDINSVVKDFHTHKRQWRGAGIFGKPLADISWMKLPKGYWVIHPYSENAPKSFRDLSPDEWRGAVEYLKRHKRPIVVVNRGEYRPSVDGVIDLTSQLSLEHSLEVVRQASGFIGCASSLSVLASKCIPLERMYVKGHWGLRHNHWQVYYAPLENPSFLYPDLRFLATRYDPDPILANLAFIADGNPFGQPHEMLEVAKWPGVAYQPHACEGKAYAGEYWREYVRREGTEVGVRINRCRSSLVEKHAKAVLDVGIGAGSFLKTCLSARYGHDVNQIAVRWLQRRQRWWDWEKDGFPKDCDGVCFWDVLEHVPQPSQWLARIPVGKLAFVTIPVVDDITKTRESKHYKPNEHLVYFTRDGFAWFANQCGMTVIDYSDGEVHAGRESVATWVLRKDK